MATARTGVVSRWLGSMTDILGGSEFGGDHSCAETISRATIGTPRSGRYLIEKMEIKAPTHGSWDVVSEEGRLMLRSAAFIPVGPCHLETRVDKLVDRNHQVRNGKKGEKREVKRTVLEGEISALNSRRKKRNESYVVTIAIGEECVRIELIEGDNRIKCKNGDM
ncbi:hypothetical protein BJ165DRAFT_1408568 [Panaeolus papilionaceus]|nr:hypothetical protein BJ165DRAFT_1408568 [Panaeolus papilionaceus]